MKPYRRRLIGLPLQRSLFAEIHHAPAIIGLHGVLPGDRFAAWLDDDGDLYLDTLDIERLTESLPARATPAFLGEMQSGLAATCEAVIETTERSWRCASSVDEAEARALLSEVGESVAALIPYGILSKFVPDALYQILKSAGDMGDPPFPAKSLGAELTRAAVFLGLSCRARGYSPDRLRIQWPDVPPDVAALVGDFCRTHTGFGPLAWEAAGYEDPHYVFGVLAGMFANEDLDLLLRRLDPTPSDPRPVTGPPQPPDVLALRLVVAAWLDFLDRETWYVRRAFYVGLVPLLHRLLPSYGRSGSGFVPEDLLFLELHELTTPPADARSAPARRAKYLADTEYFAKYGITPARLHAVMEAS